MTSPLADYNWSVLEARDDLLDGIDGKNTDLRCGWGGVWPHAGLSVPDIEWPKPGTFWRIKFPFERVVEILEDTPEVPILQAGNYSDSYKGLRLRKIKARLINPKKAEDPVEIKVEFGALCEQLSPLEVLALTSD